MKSPAMKLGEKTKSGKGREGSDGRMMRKGKEPVQIEGSNNIQEAERRQTNRDSNDGTEIGNRRRSDGLLTLEICQDFQNGECRKETPCRLIHCSPQAKAIFEEIKPRYRATTEQGAEGEGDATVNSTDQNHPPQTHDRVEGSTPSDDENEEDPTKGGRQVDLTDQSGDGEGRAKRRDTPSPTHAGQGGERNGRTADMEAELGGESRTEEIQIIKCRPKLRHNGQSNQ